MNVREKENQLAFDLRFRIVFSGFVWLCLIAAVFFRLWSLRSIPVLSSVTGATVPSLKQENIDILRSTPTVFPVRPTLVRPEPFD